MAGESQESGPAPENAAEGPASTRSGASLYYADYVGVAMWPVPSLPEGDLLQVSRHYAIKGFLFTAVGVAAILFPLVFGLAVEQFLAWLLVLGGGITLIQFLFVCGSPGTTSFLLLGALHFAVGLWLLLRPIAGLTALTYVLSTWFLVHGFLKLVLAFQVSQLTAWPAVMISGIISICLGLTILALTPIYGLRILGIVFGADLLATGVSVLLVSLMACLGHRSITGSDSATEPLLEDDGERPYAASV